MSLNPDTYIIANKATGKYLGRGVDDTSLFPKKVVILPGGVRAPFWKVQHLFNGRYRIAILYHDSPREHYAAEIDGKVFIISHPDGPIKPTEWIIRHIEGQGPHVHIVESPHSGKVWTVIGKKPYTQVVLDPMIVLAADEDAQIPYSPTQLFAFDPVPRD